MNILHIVGGLPSIEKPFHHTFVKSQIDSLKKLNINIYIINVEGHRSAFNYIKHVKTIKNLVNTMNINIIHAHYSYCGLSALLSRTKVPIILSLMGSDLFGSVDKEGNITFRGQFDRVLSKYIADHVDHIIVKSKQMADKLNLNVPVDVIPNGVDFDFFKPINKDYCRKKLGLDPKKFLILFLGNSQFPNKNFKLAETSAEDFISSVGTDKAKFISAFGISQEDIVYYINACNVLLFTSFSEGSPNVIKEAMACNLPVISTNVGDVEEVISGSERCFIVDYSKYEIVEKLKIIYSDSGRTNGRDKINHLRNEVIAEKISNLYELVYKNSKTKKL